VDVRGNDAGEVRDVPTDERGPDGACGGRRVRPIHRPWPLVGPALWAGVARRHAPMFLVSPPRRTSEVERAFGATKSQTVAAATWTKRGRVAGGTVPRPGRARLYPACAGQRPMNWASEAGARAGPRGLKATTAASRKGAKHAKRSKGKSSFSNRERAVLCVLCALRG